MLRPSTYTLIPWSATDLDAGAGAVISTVVDYARWLRSLIYRAPPLSTTGHAELMRPRTILDPESIGLQPEVMEGDVVYSLGWWKYFYRGEQIVAHGGSVPGFGTLVMFLPRMEWGVVAMANTQGTSNWVENVLVYHLLDALLGVPEAERFDWIERCVVLSAFYHSFFFAFISSREETLTSKTAMSLTLTRQLISPATPRRSSIQLCPTHLYLLPFHCNPIPASTSLLPSLT